MHYPTGEIFFARRIENYILKDFINSSLFFLGGSLVLIGTLCVAYFKRDHLPNLSHETVHHITISHTPVEDEESTKDSKTEQPLLETIPQEQNGLEIEPKLTNVSSSKSDGSRQSLSEAIVTTNQVTDKDKKLVDHVSDQSQTSSSAGTYQHVIIDPQLELERQEANQKVQNQAQILQDIINRTNKSL